jgi:hypothetical protein
MDKKIIKGLIDEKLEVIQEQFSIIKAYEGKIPVIEIDLVLANVRDLYELILGLQLENIDGAMTHQTVVAPEAAKIPPPPPSPVIQEEPVEVIPEPVVQERVSRSFISFEPVLEEKQEPEPEDQYPFPESPIPEPEADKPQKITFDLFTEMTGTTLADRLRDGQEKRVADRLTESKITDLRTIIGINDKFLFINELFDGDMRIYDEVIQKLNSAVTNAQADLLMLDLKIAYNWDSESPTVKKFVELVRRKF